MLYANQHIRMISDRSCDTEDWSNWDSEKLALHHRNKLQFKIYQHINKSSLGEHMRLISKALKVLCYVVLAVFNLFCYFFLIWLYAITFPSWEYGVKYYPLMKGISAASSMVEIFTFDDSSSRTLKKGFAKKKKKNTGTAWSISIVFGDNKSILKHTEPAQNSSEIMWVSCDYHL